MVIESHEEIWKDATTLGEVIVKLVREGKTDSQEFKSLEAWFGKEKLRRLYKEERDKQKGKKDGQ